MRKSRGNVQTPPAIAPSGARPVIGPTRTTFWPVAVTAAIIAAAVVAAYFNSLNGEFVLDDYVEVVQNQDIRRLSWDNAPALMSRAMRPLVNLTLAVNYSICGLDTWCYRATNVVIHLLATMVLFGLVRRTLLSWRMAGRFASAATPLAAGAALIWALHPLQTQSVTYVIQRSESLMGLFYLLTLYCVARAMASPGRQWMWFAAAVAAVLLGAASKQVIVTAPVVALLYARVFFAGSWGQTFARRRWVGYACLAGVWVLLGVMYSLRPPATSAGFGIGISWQEYAMSQPGVICHYLRLALWPDALCLDYSWPVARSAQEVIVPGVIIGAILAGGAAALWRLPAAGFAIISFFIILSPTSSILPIADLAFEHRMYLPLAAIAALAVTGTYWCIGKFAGDGRAAMACRLLLGLAVVAASIMLGRATHARNLDYSTAMGMWQDVTRKCPSNPRGFYQVGVLLGKQAAGAQERANELAASSPRESARLRQQAAELRQQAAGYYQKTIELKADYVEAHENLALLYFAMGQRSRAILQFRRAVDVAPRRAQTRVNLGQMLLLDERFAEAVEQFEQALEINPAAAEAHVQLAWLLATCDQAEIRDGRRAMVHALAAVDITARKDAQAFSALAAAHAELGQFAQAVEAAEEGLKIARDAGQVSLAQGIATRLRAYRDAAGR